MDAAVTMLRRLILTLFLAGLCLPAAAAPAHAASPTAASCHNAVPMDAPADDAESAGHICIGCAAAHAPAAAVAGPFVPTGLSHFPPMAALHGAETPPGTPPPRS